MHFKTYSQCGQDIFAWTVLGCPDKGTFLDIGMNEPVTRNNTYALEGLGWDGLLVDFDENVHQLSKIRRNPYFHGDARFIDWTELFAAYPSLGENKTVDYISLDVDESSFETLENLLKHGVGFKVGTFEHDSYRFGDAARNAMRRLLWGAGYYCLCSDVTDQGSAFEDWFVTKEIASKFQVLAADVMEGKEIMKSCVRLWPLKDPDPRPALGLWAPGEYMNFCRQCNRTFVGDKRAAHCADCAYLLQ